MKKVGSLFFPWHECKFTRYGDGILDYGQRDRDAAYKYVKAWRRALDVGANVGIFSCDFAKRFDDVVAFEPMPLTRECLAVNVPANVRIESCALSDEDGELVMFRAGGSGGSFVLNHPDVELPPGPYKSPPPEVLAKTVEVPARTLDSFDFDAVDLIKLDIQGAEYVALLGARETIRRHRPVVMIEEKPFSDAHADFVEKAADLLLQCGMVPKEKAGTDRVYVFER